MKTDGLVRLAGITAGEEFVRDMDWYVDDANTSGNPKEFWTGFREALKDSGMELEALKPLLPKEVFDGMD